MDRTQKRIAARQNAKLEKARVRHKQKEQSEVRNLDPYPPEFTTEEERTLYLESLMQRHNDGDQLSEDETEVFCRSLRPEEQSKFSICDDYRFYRLYLDHIHYNYDLTVLSKYSPEEQAYILDQKFSPEANQKRETELNDFYEDWKSKVYAQDQSNDATYMEVRKETKLMIKNMKAVSEKEGISEEEINEREKEIILRSRATYTKAKKIVKLNKRDLYSITFCGQEVHIDIGSLIHILFRHYAELTKQYDDERSHFSPEILTELLILRLAEILEKIDQSGHLGNSMPDYIFFNFFGRLYRVYFKVGNKSEKGKGNYSVWRVNTFYPVSAQKDIDDSKKHTPKKVEKWLEVFV